jgi:aminobenzoyl-glutamate utilization protein B
MIEGAPGHGEGHNSGMPLVVAAALAARDVMIKNGIKARLMIWPGVAEELLATKAFYVRDGLFKDVDASIFTHVSQRLQHGLGRSRQHRHGVGGVPLPRQAPRMRPARRGWAAARSTASN